MVTVTRNRPTAYGICKGFFSLFADVLFFALIFLALLLMVVNLKETFETMFGTFDPLTSSFKGNVGIAADRVAPVAIDSCSAARLATIQQQLPSEECLKHRNSPYLYAGSCSFSYATRCPQPHWLVNYLKEVATTRPRQALQVGSIHQGIDSINTMRMLSFNASYDSIKWKETIAKGNSGGTKLCSSIIDSSFPIPEKGSVSPVNMHLLERDHDRFSQLKLAHQTLSYGDSLRIVNAEMSGIERKQQLTDGTIMQHHSLDSYVKQFLKEGPIDFLSLHGGEEPAILSRADLSNVQYLEFGYHWKDRWEESQFNLQRIVNRLKDQGLICYWAGTGGNLWRITDCWQNYYDVKVWANIACARATNHGLVRSMEEHFNKTLEQGRAIEYKNRSTAETDGKV